MLHYPYTLPNVLVVQVKLDCSVEVKPCCQQSLLLEFKVCVSSLEQARCAADATYV